MRSSVLVRDKGRVVTWSLSKPNLAVTWTHPVGLLWLAGVPLRAWLGGLTLLRFRARKPYLPPGLDNVTILRIDSTDPLTPFVEVLPTLIAQALPIEVY